MPGPPTPSGSFSDSEVEVVFHQASELADPEAQMALLDRLCSGRPALRARVESLLAADRIAASRLKVDGRLPDPMMPTAHQPGVTEADGPGSVIGPYKLLQKLGEGGMGVVYEAEQTQPFVKRVALKIIKLGMDTRQVVARFEAERQALALMDHPNIAKVFDGGATANGRPYFVMQLIRGVAITEYCDRRNLSTKERLELFNKVCGAIQHAHQKGVIHRDIKPSNVLVTELDHEAVPVVIDFGVAKAINQRLTEKTLFTRYGQFIGTPAYVSPEQANPKGIDIDTRADVYSLGVLLYELLIGKTPFDHQTLLSKGFEEICRIISEQDPLKPSTRLSTMTGEELTALTRKHRIDPRRLGRLLRSDLDLVVMKAIEKDRGRRYDSATQLAEDVNRFLGGETVKAVAPSLPYRIRKFVIRHRTGLSASAAFGAVLLMVGMFDHVHRRQLYADGLVEQLLSARATSVSRILSELRPVLGHARGRLRLAADEESLIGSYRANLALLATEPESVRAVLETWPSLPVGELAAAVENLGAGRQAAIQWARANLVGSGGSKDTRLRAGVLLAQLQPDDPEWRNYYWAIARILVQESWPNLPLWRELFQPVAGGLIPPLREVFAKDGDPGFRIAAAVLLGEFLREDVATLASLLGVATADQFPYILDGLRSNSRAATDRLQQLFDLPYPTGLSPGSREAVSREKAVYGVALLHLMAGDVVWQTLSDPIPADPSLRMHLVHALAEFRVEPQALLSRLRAETNAGVRQAILSALGDYDLVVLPAELRESLRPLLINSLRGEVSAGPRSVAEWLLRQWGYEADTRLEAAAMNDQPPAANRNWFPTSTGMIMVRVHGPIVFQMGAAPADDVGFPSPRHWRRIPRTFALATRPVLIRECGAFDGVVKTDREGVVLDPDTPALILNYTNALRLCNWISRREGIPEDQLCYDDADGGLPRARTNHLSLNGYRLPTEAEWEFAGRAGAMTSRFFGESMKFMDRYCWNLAIQPRGLYPPGWKRPNGLGLFDVLGNAFEWCDGPYLPYPVGTSASNPFDDIAPPASVAVSPRSIPYRLATGELVEPGVEVDWALRGGSIGLTSEELSLARREPNQPRRVHEWAAVRLARTVPAPD